MNGITILLWIAIFVIGAVAAVGVKRHYGNAELGKDDKPSLSKENKKGLFSFGNKNDSDKNRLSQPNLNYTTQEAPKDNYPAEEIKTSTTQNIEYESPNQVLIDYENEVKKFHEPMTQNQIDIMTSNNEQNEKHELVFSPESTAVLNAGRELWKYYFTMEAANPNASLYDIKEYFQGRDPKGKMNASSDDKYYTELLENLKAAFWDLTEQIKPKVYEYGFLI